jgi:hypothetical protein
MKPIPTRMSFVMAHPGHELRVHHWLEVARPVVHVLTDGSGSLGRSRLSSTRGILNATGARPGLLFGRFTDRDLYSLLLDRRWDVFCDEVRSLARALEEDGSDAVVGDAIEGFNPGHDVARLLLNTAVTLLRARGRAVANLEFEVEGPPAPCAADAAEWRLDLDEDALARKVKAARGYAEMTGEVEEALARHGEAPFRCECLRPAPASAKALERLTQPPRYEAFGEARVEARVYRRVIRLDEHVLPLAHALTTLEGEASR